MLVDRYGAPLTSADLFRDAANKAVVGPGVNVYTNGVSIAGMNPRKYMEQAQALYYSNPWIRTAEGIISKKLSTADYRVMIDTPQDDTEEQVFSGPAVEILQVGSPRQSLTRSKLWQITSRHMGLCNNAFWYLDPNGSPEEGVIYINPARMTPVSDKAGYLAFWLVDADDYGEDGVRFEKDEILWFQLEAADVGFFGHGLVYSALLKATLSTAADRHALQVLETGGRLQGILTPTKDDYINDFAFTSMQRELRNVTELEDSAKRMVLLRKAVEFTRTTQTASELELTTLMRTSKEDIYEIWGVPRSQTGGMTEVGMNSGDRQSYEEAALQQNAIHPRVVVFEETINYLLRRYDPRYELEFQEPEFDDERPLYEMLKMSEFAPMTRNERRRLIKLPPIDGEPGKVVEQNPGLLQIIPPLPIARSYITGRLQDGTTVDMTNTPLDPQQHLDAINTARGAPKQTVGKAQMDSDLGQAIAERIIEKADHFLAKPGDLDMIAPQKLVTRVTGASDILREVHDGLKAIILTGRANDWAVEEYAEAVRGAALVPDHLTSTEPVMSAPPPSSKAAEVKVTIPNINVEPTPITVSPTPITIPPMDMTPIAKAIEDMGQRIIEGMPEPAKIPAYPKPERYRFVLERDADGKIIALAPEPA